MARDFGPFPTKPMYEVVNRRMQKALAESVTSTGFVKSGQGAVTAGTGAQLIIAAYPDGALVDGLWVENSTSETVTLTTNSGSTNPRIDRLVLRLDMGAQTIAPFQIVGTPGASPQAPPLVQTATTYDMPLCQYRFPGSASAQNPGSIVDERVSSRPMRSKLVERVSGTVTDAYGATRTNLLGDTWVAAPAGDYLVHATLAVKSAAGPSGEVFIVANGTTITKPGTRADTPATTADVFSVLSYTRPYTHTGGDLAVTLDHQPNGSVTVNNATTQMVLVHLGQRG